MSTVLSPVVFSEAAALIHTARRIVVTAHVNPDADAVGASVGLSQGLRLLGKDVTTALSDPVPEYARFLQGTDAVVDAMPTGTIDLLMCLDAADIERIGLLYAENRERFASTPVVNIDHHRTNPGYGTVNCVVPSASSTSELVFRLLTTLEVALDADTASTLLFGIFGDTGSFQNGATTPESLEVAGALVRAGADVQRIAFQLFERKRFVAAKLWGETVSTVQLDAERRIVFAHITQQMLLRSGATMDETEGVAEYLRGIEEADVVVLMKETPEGEMRVSMRSRPAIDVSAIATALGGGGHRQAAGFTVSGPLDKARETLIAAYDALNPR